MPVRLRDFAAAAQDERSGPQHDDSHVVHALQECVRELHSLCLPVLEELLEQCGWDGREPRVPDGPATEKLAISGLVLATQPFPRFLDRENQSWEQNDNPTSRDCRAPQ